MEPFSVLMSVYAKEQERLLDRALESVLLRQNVKPAEIVLVEDGPLTEELYRVIEKYKRLFTGFVSVKLPYNGGLGNALNAGLKSCAYEWVARMDSDDISLPDRFEKQGQYIEAHPEVDVLGCAVSEFSTDTHIIESVKICPERIENYIKFRSPVNHPTVFFKKSSVERAGGYRHCLYMEDYHLWIRMYSMGMKISSLPEPLYLFKMDTGTQKRRGGWKYLRSEWKIQSLLLKYRIISFPRYCFNLITRGGGRLIPSGFRSFLYKSFLRSSVSENIFPEAETSNLTE